MNTEIQGFHVICGLSLKNGIDGIAPGIKSYCGTKDDKILDLKGFNSLLVVDLEYFVNQHEEIIKMVKEQIEGRDNYIQFTTKTE